MFQYLRLYPGLTIRQFSLALEIRRGHIYGTGLYKLLLGNLGVLSEGSVG